MRTIEPNWILMPNRIERDGWQDPDIARMARNVTPSGWQRLKYTSRGLCKTITRRLADAWQQAIYNLASAILPTPRFAGA